MGLLKSSVLVAILVAATSARAEDVGAYGSIQTVGLFTAACLRLANDQGQMRTLMTKRVPRLTDQARAALMPGKLGIGFDASTARDRLALISEDDGTCTAIGERADDRQTIERLEAALKTLNAVYKLEREGDDPRTPALHHRFYAVSLAGRSYSLVTSTSVAPDHMQAFLTLAPKPPL